MPITYLSPIPGPCLSQNPPRYCSKQITRSHQPTATRTRVSEYAVRLPDLRRRVALLAQPVHGLRPAEAAQLEMADFGNWFRDSGGKCTGHEQRPADVLAEEFQPAEDIEVASGGGEVEPIAGANVTVGGNAAGQYRSKHAAGSPAARFRARPAPSAPHQGPTGRPAMEHHPLPERPRAPHPRHTSGPRPH